MEAVVLRPQVGQGPSSFGEGEVVPYPLGHHAPPPVLARVDSAKSPVSNVLQRVQRTTGGWVGDKGEKVNEHVVKRTWRVGAKGVILVR